MKIDQQIFLRRENNQKAPEIPQEHSSLSTWFTPVFLMLDDE